GHVSGFAACERLPLRLTQVVGRTTCCCRATRQQLPFSVRSQAVIRLWSPPAAHPRAPHPAIAAALKDCRRAFSSVALFSGMVNILTLAAPLYMLQVYDRVLASHSVPTLVALSVLLCGAFALQGFMDLIRSRVVTRSAGFLDEHLSAVVHKAIIRLSAAGRQPRGEHEPVRDLYPMPALLARRSARARPRPRSNPGFPHRARPDRHRRSAWLPVFLVICSLIHPWLGMLA